LAVGDYLSSSGSNYSFGTDPQRNWDSWKRFLRGTSGTRQVLKTLWDRIDVDRDIEPQLEHIIANAVGLEPWRAAIISHPEVISYCWQQEIRREGGAGTIYLLRKKQMSGYHAELFSYVLHLDLADPDAAHNLIPLTLQPYQSVYLTEFEPHVLLAFDRSNRRVNLVIESAKGQFRVHVSCAELEDLSEVESALCRERTFVKEDEQLTRLVSRAEIHQLLQQVAQRLANLPDVN
jgi:hypothetical protein